MAWRRVGGAGAAPEGRSPAEARLAELDRNAERLAREAYDTGFREGQAAGRSQAAAELQSALERLAASIAELASLRSRLRREAEADLVQLSLAIARRVLRRELAVDPEAVRGLVLGALEKLQSIEIARVRVHPSHAAAIASCLQGLANEKNVEVVPDSACAPGGVIFETQRGNLDASVDTQLLEIERGLADRLSRS
jgi:flagellar assembly protein FliH